MFHVADHLFFGRMADGGVRILKYSSAPISFPTADQSRDKPNEWHPVLDARIPASVWASIVASVSAKGENDGRFFIAQDFHAGEDTPCKRS